MNCSDLEIRLCEFVDGTLPAAEKAEVERHLAECAACAELARDSADAVAFMERAATVEPPPELITKILFEAPWSEKPKAANGARKWLAGILGPVLQPRFAMGMAMTILSFSMLARFVAPVRQLRPADLQPAAVLSALEDKGYRAWARTVKFYENLKFVYQIQTTLREWQQQQDEEQTTEPENSGRTTDDKKLPVRGQTPGMAPAPAPSGGSR